MTNLTLDPRAAKVQVIAKTAGVGLVAVAASAAVIVAGASIAVAGTAALVGLFMVNYLVPVGARSIALWKQKSLTVLAETFSEETLREDERKESDRIKMLETQYVEARAEIEGAQDELKKQLKESTKEEGEMINAQIGSLQSIINNAEEMLKTRKSDFVELTRLNKLYIALHRGAAAMEKAQGSERTSQQMQDIQTARDAIKNKMRAAMAGKTIDAMNLAIKPKAERISDVILPRSSK